MNQGMTRNTPVLARVFHGTGSVGPFRYHEFTLKTRGVATILHAHDYDHATFANKPVGIYAIGQDDGLEKIERVGFFDMRMIAAHTHHLVFALEDDTDCRCMFSAIGPDGKEVADCMRPSRAPYTEFTDYGQLPELVRRALENGLV